MTNYTAEQVLKVSTALQWESRSNGAIPIEAVSMLEAFAELLREREFARHVATVNQSNYEQIWADGDIAELRENIGAKLYLHPPRESAEPVGTLSIRKYKGLENTHFDYSGSLSDGDYMLYTHPPRESATTTELQMLPGDLQVLADLGFKQTAERIAAELKRARKSSPVVPDGLDIDTLKAISIDERSWKLFNKLKDAGAEYVEDDSGAWLTVTVEDIRLMFELMEAKP